MRKMFSPAILVPVFLLVASIFISHVVADEPVPPYETPVVGQSDAPNVTVTPHGFPVKESVHLFVGVPQDNPANSPNAPNGSVTVTSAWTTDGDNNPQTVFFPGDPIRYYGNVYNSTGITATAYFVWSRSGPCGTVSLWSGNLNTGADTWIWLLPGTIPNGCPGSYTYTLTVTYGGQTSSQNATFTIKDMRWKLSPVWTGPQEGPQDTNGRYWNDPLFDDSSWATTPLPDSGSDSSANDRYYRAHFNWDGASTLKVHFGADDGLAIYINGNLLGSWGYGWRQPGCVNDPFGWCGGSINVPDQSIPSSMLKTGDNIIAIDLWNGTICCYYGLDASILYGPPVYSISGQVSDDSSTPISGVTVKANSDISATTDALGHYTITDLITGTYVVTPTLSGYRFAPTTRTTVLPRDRGQSLNFIIRPATPTLRLDLPVVYTNTTDMSVAEMFVVAASGSSSGEGPGRVNSWFDHALPLYRRPNDIMSRWDGWDFYYPKDKIDVDDNRRHSGCNLGTTCYDYHNGIDFRHQDSNAKEVVIAAASGTVTATTGITGYGNQVLIDHHNGYATLYGHLQTISVTVGANVTAQQPLGIMGSSISPGGRSTGVHLHFGLYYDLNGDRTFSETEVVDPYGWDLVSRVDPWGVPSHYLWRYPMYGQCSVNDLGTSLTSASGQITIGVPPNAVASSVTMQLWDVPPIMRALAEWRSIGRSFRLRVLEWLSGDSINEMVSATSSGFAQPVTVTIGYSDTQMLHLNENQLTVFHWDDGISAFVPLSTTVNSDQKRVVAQTSAIGNFDLQAPLICPADAQEPNDNYYAASPITANSASQSQLFDIVQDQDWFRLETWAGGKYVVQTGDLAPDVDTILQLYDVDGVTMLAQDDNGGGGTASRLEWYAPASGVYFIRATKALGSAYGCNASYNISATQELRLYMPLVVK